MYGLLWEHLHVNGAGIVAIDGVSAVDGVQQHHLSMGLIPIGQRRRWTPSTVPSPSPCRAVWCKRTLKRSGSVNSPSFGLESKEYPTHSSTCIAICNRIYNHWTIPARLIWTVLDYNLNQIAFTVRFYKSISMAINVITCDRKLSKKNVKCEI